jgi:hypothetical protein
VTCFVVGSTATTAPLPSSATQTRPSEPSATPHGLPSSLIVSATAFVEGSTRTSSAVALPVIQADVASTAIAHGASGTVIVATRRSPSGVPVGTGIGVAGRLPAGVGTVVGAVVGTIVAIAPGDAEG